MTHVTWMILADLDNCIGVESCGYEDQRNENEQEHGGIQPNSEK